MDRCYLDVWPSLNHRKAYTLALFILQFVLPLLVIAAAYLKIGVYLRRSTSLQIFPSWITSKNNWAQIQRKKKNMQLIKTLALIVIFFAICLLPGQIGFLLWEFGDEQDQPIMDAIFKFADILDCLHACVNPIVYGLLTEQFRKEYIRYLSYCLSCGTNQVNTVHGNENVESPEDNLSPAIIERRKPDNEAVETIADTKQVTAF